MIYYFDNRYVLMCLLLLFLILSGFFKFVKKKSGIYLLFFSIMYIYLCQLVRLTQFPIYASESMREVMGGQNVWKEMNLLPFKTILDNLSVDVLLNVIMTLPLGFGLPFLARCSWGKIMFAGIMTGIFSEIGQLLSALWVGFTFRHVNIDDVILNFFGALLGYVLFKVFCYVFCWSYQKLKITTNTLLTYILNVCDGSSEVLR